ERDREPPARFGQQLVAGAVAKTAVDQLEIVKIQEEHRDRLGLAAAALEGATKVVHEGGTIGQPGERIVECFVAQPVLEQCARSHFALQRFMKLSGSTFKEFLAVDEDLRVGCYDGYAARSGLGRAHATSSPKLAANMSRSSANSADFTAELL